MTIKTIYTCESCGKQDSGVGRDVDARASLHLGDHREVRGLVAVLCRRCWKELRQALYDVFHEKVPNNNCLPPDGWKVR